MSLVDYLNLLQFPSWVTSHPYYPKPLILPADDPRLFYAGDVPNRDMIPIMLISFLVHIALFYLCPIPRFMIPKDGSGNLTVIRNYLVSTIHATNACLAVFAFYWFFDRNLDDYARLIGGGRNGLGDEYGQYLIAVSCGYFLYDFLVMTLHRKDLATNGAFLHHFLAGSCLIAGLFYHMGHHAHFIMLLEEFSTPFLNLKTLLKHHPKSRKFFELAFVPSFIGCRLVYGSYVFYRACMIMPDLYVRCMANDDAVLFVHAFIQVFCCGVLRILNIYWTVLILKKTAAVLFGGGKKQNKKNNTNKTD